VTLRVLVSQRTAGSLNLDARALDHTVIIHALGGKDYFVAVSGDYGAPPSSVLRCKEELTYA
jgi:hypothetical protein